MQSEERLRFIHRILLESWKLFKAHSGEPNSDDKWDAVMSESSRICNDVAGDDPVAKQIVFGFVAALEEEDKAERRKERLRQ